MGRVHGESAWGECMGRVEQRRDASHDLRRRFLHRLSAEQAHEGLAALHRIYATADFRRSEFHLERRGVSGWLRSNSRGAACRLIDLIDDF